MRVPPTTPLMSVSVPSVQVVASTRVSTVQSFSSMLSHMIRKNAFGSETFLTQVTGIRQSVSFQVLLHVPVCIKAVSTDFTRVRFVVIVSVDMAFKCITIPELLPTNGTNLVLLMYVNISNVKS